MFFKFVRKSILELKKMTWPKYGEVVSSGKQVFWFLFFTSIFLGMVDYFMYLAITYLF